MLRKKRSSDFTHAVESLGPLTVLRERAVIALIERPQNDDMSGGQIGECALNLRLRLFEVLENDLDALDSHVCPPRLADHELWGEVNRGVGIGTDLLPEP